MTKSTTSEYRFANSRRLAMLGAALLVLGTLVHEWTLTALLQPAEPFRRAARFHWWYVSLNAWAIGVWLLVMRRRLQTVAVAGVCLMCGVLITLLVAIDLWRGYTVVSASVDERKVTGEYLVREEASGWTLKPGVTARVERANVYDATYSIDNRGWRRTVPSVAGSRQVLVLGDSFAFGWGVNDNETLCSYLAAKVVDKARVVNLAVEGYGVTQIYVRFRQHAELIKPGDVVLLTLIADDISRNLPDFVFVSRMFFGPRPLRTMPVYEDGTVRVVETGTQAEKLKAIAVHAPWLGSVTAPLLIRDPELSQDEATRMIDEIRKQTEARLARFLVVQLPTGGEMWHGRPALNLTRYGAVQIAARFPADLQSRRELFMAPDDGHYSSKGNRLVGQILYDLLRERSWIDS